MQIKLIRRFLYASFKTQLEYRFAFIVDLSVQFFAYTVTFVNIWIIFNNFNEINGWNYYQIFFLFNLNLLSYGICGLLIYTPTQNLEQMIQDGTFDTYLIRPINPFFHLILKNISPLFLAHILISVIIFVLYFNKFEINWTIYKVGFLILVLIGSVLIQASIMIITSSLSFWIIKSSAITNTMIYGLRNFIVYPLTIYNKFIQVILTFIIPYGFINYFPATYFFDKSEYLFHPLLEFGTPIVGLCLLCLAKFIWNLGLRKYQSTGN